MDLNVFNVEKFNIIQDEENYYFFRALNMADNNDIEQGITTSGNGKIERIRTDRERFEGKTKYSEDSEISLEELYDHIKMHYRKDTNCISLTSNSNVAVNYGRGSYKDRYVMIKIPKKEFGGKTVTAGQYMLQELYSRIQQEVEKLPEEEKGQILSIFDDIEDATEIKTLQDIIVKRYTAKTGEVNPSKAHLRKGITYSSPKARISSYQALDEEQLLEVNKVYAKLAILENEDILKHVIPHSSNSKLRETIGNAFSSTEVIHYGDIKEENIIEIPKEVADIFALIQQVNGIDENRIEELKRVLIIDVQNGSKIPQISDITSQVKDNISIEEMYELTEGKVEYGKANSIVKNMFYLSKSRQNAIALSNVLAEILGDNLDFEDIIEHIRENGFRVEPEIISRKSGKGVELSESVNLNLQKEEQSLIDEIKELSSDELDIVLQNGGLYNARDIITKTFSNISENEKIDKSRYYAEAIVAQYNWQDIGIEEIKADERNELIARLQEKNCAEIYERLKKTGMEESRIPTVLFNIAMRDGFYEQYKEGNLVPLLNERQDILQDNINIELVERFLGYYDVENTGIKLKDYQQRANDNINRIFENHKFAQVILPTGAGKSFVALAQMQQYALTHPNEKMLYLAPQDEILNQIKSYIVKYVHGKKGTVGKTEDEIIAEIFPNITFETYSGLLAKRGQEVVKDQYGMIVLDELHRTGAKEWEGKIDKLLENQTDDVKVLGITATPTRDVDGRDMENETAKKLGYTDEEIKQRKHLASNMTLENAIRMGYVVNPKLVYCKYDLISSGKMDELRARIDSIEDETKRAEELQKYNELRQKLNREIDAEIGEEARKKLEEDARKNLDSGIGKEEILRQNVKKSGKYIVFIPVSDQGDIEDENGNRIGTKTGEDKIKAYQDYLNKMFEGTDIVPQLHSLLGSYSKDKNKEELEAFESDDSEKTKFMVVMNKANEGLHIDGVDGIIWFRALDENSRILYLQQLGRAIYALDEDNPLPDNKRPVVIDLANNSLTVKVEKEFENAEPIDDLEALTIVIEWIEQHDGMLPDSNSSNKQEQHYYAILRRIQNKYSKYLDGFDNFEDLTEEDKSRIQEIIDLATGIDLWNIELPPIPKSRGNNKEINPFEITGVLKDYLEMETHVSTQLLSVQIFIDKLVKLQSIGVDVSKLVTTDTIQTLAKKSGVNNEKIIEINLQLDDKIGNTKNNIASAYRGNGDYTKPTEEQVKKLLELGISLEIRDPNQELIDILETLQRLGIDISKISVKDTIKTLAEKSGVNEDEIRKSKIDPNIRIGGKLSHVSQRYRGTAKGNPPTKEQIDRLLQFGISLEKKDRNATQELIEMLEQLQTIGVDVSKLQYNDTIETLAQRSAINLQAVKNIGLNPNIKIGNKKSIVAKLFRGQAKGNKPTKQQLDKLTEFGIFLEKKERNRIEDFIETLEQLQEIGVDVFKIQWNDTIKSLAQKSEISEIEIRKLNLDPDEKIGQTKNNISSAYRGNVSGQNPTEEQLQRLLTLGISLDKKDGVVEEFIKKLEQLQEIGVDVSRLASKDTIQTLAKKSGISEEALREIRLNPDEKICNTREHIAKLYRGSKKGGSITEEQINRLLQLGISLEKKDRNAPQELIETLEQLQEIGVDVSRLASKDTIQTLAEKSGIGIDDLIKFNLDPKENIGSKKTSIGRVIRGKEKGNIPTEEQFKRLLELGISFENKGKLQQAKQNRDVAIERNNKAKELEGQVSEELKKRGKNYDEQ